MGLTQLLFGCWHRNLSSIWTFKNTTGKGKTTYRVCLDCGKKFAWSWETLKPIKKTENQKQSVIPIEAKPA